MVSLITSGLSAHWTRLPSTTVPRNCISKATFRSGQRESEYQFQEPVRQNKSLERAGASGEYNVGVVLKEQKEIRSTVYFEVTTDSGKVVTE
ncbi:hypothetical protein chiPu_0006380 [Chiloscyllium punctatum]|uniref:Uncharacterized protein n=1 Tax=Chiloscyllium punctatum TaxID=137246 RepID=A0A401SC70_CHIPU|nr:hypothetical protein [Chiloscyllium punctatum]